MEELVFDGQTYVSSKRAAQITGYAKDYVGQLCREGRVDARLVGRNWYVLESSIREHRFGKEGVSAQDPEPDPENTEPEAQEAAEEAPNAPAEAWKPARYEVELPAYVPPLASKGPEPTPAASQGPNPDIAEMHSAWQEWFSDKKPVVPALSDGNASFKDEYLPMRVEQPAPEAQNAPQEPQEEEDSSDTVEEPSSALYEQSEAIPIHRTHAPTAADIAELAPNVTDLSHAVAAERGSRRRLKTRSREATDRESNTLRALLLATAGISILIALIGTGNAGFLFSDKAFQFGTQKSLLDYLGGTRFVDNTL